MTLTERISLFYRGWRCRSAPMLDTAGCPLWLQKRRISEPSCSGGRCRPEVHRYPGLSWVSHMDESVGRIYKIMERVLGSYKLHTAVELRNALGMPWNYLYPEESLQPISYQLEFSFME